MKKSVKIIFAFMGLLACIGFFTDISTFLFAEGSNCMMNLAYTSSLLQLIIVVVLVGFYYIKNRIAGSLTKLIVIVFMIIFFICGRTIGLVSFPEKKILTGWFYIPTSKTIISRDDTSLNENQQIQPVLIKRKQFWFIEVCDGTNTQLIFVGPFIWNKTIGILSDDSSFIVK